MKRFALLALLVLLLPVGETQAQAPRSPITTLDTSSVEADTVDVLGLRFLLRRRFGDGFYASPFGYDPRFDFRFARQFEFDRRRLLELELRLRFSRPRYYSYPYGGGYSGYSVPYSGSYGGFSGGFSAGGGFCPT